MDVRELLECFASTLNPDASTRTSAEARLKRAATVPGFLGACLEIISSSEVPDNVKLSACLYFKNKIVYGWRGPKTGRNNLLGYVVDNDEKPVVKDMLLGVMLQCSESSPSCLRILKSALSVIITEDYPQKSWDSLLPKSLELLSGGDVDNAYVGLICLSEIFRTYRWSENDSRQELEPLILQYFPDLLEFAKSHLFNGGANMDNPKVGEMVVLVLKIYKFVIYYDLPFTLQRPELFVAWANFLVSIIQCPLSPDFLANTSTEERSKNPWVKSKKWALFDLFRLFQRYASQSLTRKFEYNEFKQLYQDELLPQLLQLFFQQIEQWGSKQLWLSDECLYFILNFIEQTTVQKSTWKLIKPYYATILEHVVFPLLRPDEHTLDTFENDPQEYLHRNLELWDDSYSPDIAAVSFLTTAVSKRGKTTLQPTLEFILTTLQNNLVDNETLALEQTFNVESCLRIFSNIIDRLTVNNSPFMSQIEDFLRIFVFPLFNSKYPILRTRACEICSKLGDFEFKDPSSISILYEGISHCLHSVDSGLPVMLLAALAMQAYIHTDVFKQLLSGVVVETMQKLLSISNEFESDAISGVMQDFVEEFSEQLQPFGVELMNNLVQQFLKLAIDLYDASNIDPTSFTASSNDLPDETDKQMAALGILSTAISILLSFENSPEIVKNLEQSFYPAAEYILNNEMDDFYRECCEFFENSSFLLHDITPIAWKVLELVGQCNKKEGSMVAYYLEDFMLALNNYMVYGKEELKKNEFYTKILFGIYQRAATSEDNAYDELKVIFDLSQKLILALGDQLDPTFRQIFLDDAVNAILQEKDMLKTEVAFGVTSFNVVVASLSSSPVFTLQYLQRREFLAEFLEIWLTFYVPNFTRVYDIKLSIMALLRVLHDLKSQDFQALSVDVAVVGRPLVSLLNRFPAALKSLEAKRSEFSANAMDPSTWSTHFPLVDNEEEEDGDEEVDEEEIKQYMEMLHAGGANSAFTQDDAFNDAADFAELDEDPLTGSILDDVNVYDSFKTVFLTLQQPSEVEKYHALTTSMSQEDQAFLASLLQS